MYHARIDLATIRSTQAIFEYALERKDFPLVVRRANLAEKPQKTMQGLQPREPDLPVLLPGAGHRNNSLVKASFYWCCMTIAVLGVDLRAAFFGILVIVFCAIIFYFRKSPTKIDMKPIRVLAFGDSLTEGCVSFSPINRENIH